MTHTHVRESHLTWPFVPSQHSQPNTQSFVFTWFYIMTKEELQNYGQNKTTTTPETTKQEDFRQPPAHARFTHIHSHTRQFGECHHMHNNSHSTTHAPLMTFHRIINKQDKTTHMRNSNVTWKQNNTGKAMNCCSNRLTGQKPAIPSVCNQEIKTKTSSSHLTTTTPVTQHQKNSSTTTAPSDTAPK